MRIIRRYYRLLSALLCLSLAFALLPPLRTAARADEPEWRRGGLVSFDGLELPSGSLYRGTLAYVKLSEAVDALGLTLEHEAGGDTFGFVWRKSYVTLRAGTERMRYLDEDRVLEAAAVLCDDGADLLVPVRSFCEGAQIGYLYDEEYDHIYCTPGAGAWEVPSGYNVPVMMYHAVGWGSEKANLFVNPSSLERQIVYLLDHGYTPIWFEDLEHVEDYEKPILLTFDDGWQNNYTNLLPLCKKYEVKVTVFLVWKFIHPHGNHLSAEEAMEMYESGYVSFQSHTMDHSNLTTLPPEKWDWELGRSRLLLTRLFGKEPFVLSYPIGGSNPAIESLARDYYHFAVKMTSDRPYNTSDDPILIYRFFPEKRTPFKTYVSWLKSAFPS